MDWNTYYEKFYDWANSTQINRLSQLTFFGPADEVTEVAQELLNEKAASRLIRKALAAGVTFSAENIYDLMDCCDTATMNLLLAAVKCRFTQEQLEDFWGGVDDAVLEKTARRNGVTLFEDEDPEWDDEPWEPEPIPEPKLGFWAALGLGGLFAEKEDRHNGCCSGDCAHCPPHYGYRYGRWYYGHSHTYGCELGGNHGDGRD